MSNADGLTTRASFSNIPAIDNDLFEVRAGIDAEWATSKAVCLAASIEHVASDAVQGGMSSEVAYLVAFAAEAIQGLPNSVEGVHSRQAVQS